MDLQQRKLTKSEWESIEIPVQEAEQEVLRLIIQGFHDVNIKYNKTESLFGFLKIDYNEDMEDYLYNKYFSERVNTLIAKHDLASMTIRVNANPQIKKADLIRLQKNTIESVQKVTLFEHILLDAMEIMCKEKCRFKETWILSYYSLYKLICQSVRRVNRHIVSLVRGMLELWEPAIPLLTLIKNAVPFIEKNEALLRYSDMQLYEHQKKVFSIVKQQGPKLVLYIAPTGTGKTLTPLGLSENHRVLFVCAARHVGLALARSAISMQKKIAFAFGCGSAADIRLHYYAATEITKNRKTGGIWKVDNSVGDKVEIMICDIKSYLPAMYYMLAFNEADNIVTYWDEPTITLDYKEHEFHPIIQKNWSDNKIPNMVLSSATLPKVHELTDTLSDFKERFPGAQVHSVVSHDCKKSIPIVSKTGDVVLPHFISPEFNDMQRIVQHCENYLTLLRYFDLKEVVRFICYVEEEKLIPKSFRMERHFGSLEDVDVKQVKLYYLRLLKNIPESAWPQVYSWCLLNREKRIASNEAVDTKGNRIRKVVSVGPGTAASTMAGAPISRLYSEQIQNPQQAHAQTQVQPGIYVTTKDAFTLTSGPTLFLANDVEKIAKFCIQQANIPAKVMDDIVEKIQYNNTINDKMETLEKEIEYLHEKEGKNTSIMGAGGEKRDHKLTRETDGMLLNKDMKKLIQELEMLRSMIRVTKLNDTFVPNTMEHLRKWAEEQSQQQAFGSDIEDETIAQIMMLKNVEDSWKVLLLMGIGVFTEHKSIAYTEIMKRLADHQKLYLIIASSDYIYGTNYQFCHGYLSKDMCLTQEKIIQAMGRVGRNNVQQEYTLRLRDDDQINKIFYVEEDKIEVRNMNLLFAVDKN